MEQHQALLLPSTRNNKPQPLLLSNSANATRTTANGHLVHHTSTGANPATIHSTNQREVHPTLNTDLMLPSSFQGEGERIHTSKEQPEAPNTNSTRTVLVRTPYDVPMTKSMTELQDSYDALTPSASEDSQLLIGYREDPQQQQQQSKQQKVEWNAAKAPRHVRDVLKQKEQQNRLEVVVHKKKARELAKSDAQSTSSTPFPTQQPEVRRVRFSKELLSQTEHDSLIILQKTRCVCNGNLIQEYQIWIQTLKSLRQPRDKESQRT